MGRWFLFFKKINKKYLSIPCIFIIDYANYKIHESIYTFFTIIVIQ